MLYEAVLMNTNRDQLLAKLSATEAALNKFKTVRARSNGPQDIEDVASERDQLAVTVASLRTQLSALEVDRCTALGSDRC